MYYKVLQSLIADDSNVELSKTYDSFDLDRNSRFAIQVTWGSSTVDANVTIQATNDEDDGWCDVQGVSQDISDGSGSVIFNLVDQEYRYIRAKVEVLVGSLSSLKVRIYSKS